MARIYVASSWRNHQQKAIVELLRADGHEVYDFKAPENAFEWSRIDEASDTWTRQEYFDGLSHKLANTAFNNDFSAMMKADICVLVLPCGSSAHLEAGYFAGHPNKGLVIFIPEPEDYDAALQKLPNESVQHFRPELMYLMANAMCTELDELLDAVNLVHSINQKSDFIGFRHMLGAHGCKP